MESLKYESPRVSLMAQIETALSYDDVLLLPAESAVLPAEVDLTTRLTTGITLNAPIVSAAMDIAIQRARSGEGPTFLEIKTYRYKGHSMSDAQHYRTKDEIKEYQKIDPIDYVLNVIKEKKYASLKEIERINESIKQLVMECVEFAEESPFPEPDDLYQDIYVGPYNFIKD